LVCSATAMAKTALSRLSFSFDSIISRHCFQDTWQCKC